MTQAIATAPKLRPLNRLADGAPEPDTLSARVLVVLKPDQQIRATVWCCGLVAEYIFEEIDKARCFWDKLGELLVTRAGKDVSITYRARGVVSIVCMADEVARDFWLELGLVIKNADRFNQN